MFYNKSVMKSKMLGNTWRVANNVSTETDEAESDLSKICNKIFSWVENDTEEVEGRMSLRTSSTLVGGVAKLYKTGMEQLLDDANKLNEDIIAQRKRPLSTTTDSSESNTASDTVASPEEIRRCTNMQMVTSITPRKKHKTISVSPNIVSMEHSMDRSSSGCSWNARSYVTNDGHRFSGYNIRSPENAKNYFPTAKDQGTQTPGTLFRGESNSSTEEDFNANLPFGYIIIHDSFSSRIPSSIILSSINADVTQLT